MPGPVFLRGEAVTLRPFAEEDVDFVTELINDPRVWGSLASYRPKTESQEREWIENVGDGEGVHLLICADDQPVGTIGLSDVDETWGVAELGYMVSPDSQGHGYATDASRRLVRYAFGDLRLHKITANAYENNSASQRVLEKVGFQEEGQFRKHAYVRGEYLDVLRYGLLDSEVDF
jgi:RimJ/RimL family protein N-acetyltransferase